MSPSSSSSSCIRWSPTPQQVMILEDLYRRGVRTPNAFQRQIITAHLSFYGHIQPKNVFYWFQNHKARDRRKLFSKKQQLRRHLYPNQQSNILDFHNKPNKYFHAQGGGEEFREEMMKQEHSKMEVHDLMMMLESCPCCSNRPLVTLQLFPLTSCK